jgi:adenosylcobinamide-GDP ribazoletransferase
MTALRAALALLTRIPLAGTLDRADQATGLAAFGAAGALLGAAAALPILIFAAAPLVAATLAVAALALLSGALHLDGLADTADALAAPDPTRAEAARKDPRIGAAGMVAVLLVVLLDVTALAALLSAAGPVAGAVTLVAVAAMSRGAATVLVHVHRRAARDGAAAWFARAASRPSIAGAAGSAAAVAVLASVLAASPLPAAGGLGAAIGTLGGGGWLIGRRNGIDGDAIGASMELGLAGGLVTALGAVLAFRP